MRIGIVSSLVVSLLLLLGCTHPNEKNGIAGVITAVMAHVLPVQQQHSILTLAKQGWSIRRIARELGVHRKTVRA